MRPYVPKRNKAFRRSRKRCKYNPTTGLATAGAVSRKVLAGAKMGYGTILALSFYPERLSLRAG